MSIRLYVGNLPKEVDRKELQDVFSEGTDASISTKVITDRKTGKCRGFGFVTVKNDEEADQFIEKFNGYMFQDTPLKIEKALPRKKGKNNEEEGTVPPPPASKNTSSGSSAGGGRRNTKTKRTGTSSSNTDPDAIQPDPRWAEELEKLKQMLAAQASNS